MTDRPVGEVRALAKGLAVLELLARAGEERSLAAISAELKFNRSTTHHLLATLREHGFVDQDTRTRHYRLGYRLVSLVNEFLADVAVSSVGTGPVHALRDETGDTTYLTILQGWEPFTIFEAPGNHPISTDRRRFSGQTFLHATASGKTLLAYQARDKVLAAMANVELTAFTAHTISTRDDLYCELAQIQEQGFALDQEEFLIGVFSVAAPVFDRSRACVATVSVVYPAVQSARTDVLIPKVIATASQISRALGCEASPMGVNRGDCSEIFAFRSNLASRLEVG